MSCGPSKGRSSNRSHVAKFNTYITKLSVILISLARSLISGQPQIHIKRNSCSISAWFLVLCKRAVQPARRQLLNYLAIIPRYGYSESMYLVSRTFVSLLMRLLLLLCRCCRSNKESLMKLFPPARVLELCESLRHMFASSVGTYKISAGCLLMSPLFPYH